MTNVLFATCAIGEKYIKRCLTSIKSFDKLDYDKSDELIIYTDDIKQFDNINSKIKITAKHFSINLKGNNFRDNTLLKHLCLSSALLNNNTHHIFVWFDCDSFPVETKQSLQKYNDYSYGIFYKDAHTFTSYDELLDHHLYKQRGFRYNNNNFLQVLHKDNRLLEYAFNKNEELTFPVETCLLIKRDCSSNEYNNIEKIFCNTIIDVVKYCMDFHLNDNYGESYELGIIIGKSFKTINQMPVVPCMCDFHYMPADSTEQDIERYQDKPLYKRFLL